MERHRSDRYLTAAINSSLHARNLLDVVRAVEAPENLSNLQLATLYRLTRQHDDRQSVLALTSSQIRRAGDEATLSQLRSFADLLDNLDAGRTKLTDLLRKGDDPVGTKNLRAAALVVNRLALRTIRDPKASTGDLALSLRFLGRGLNDDEADFQVVAKLAARKVPDDVMLSVVRMLGNSPKHHAALAGLLNDLTPEPVALAVVDAISQNAQYHKLLAAQLNPRTPDRVQRAVIVSLGKSDKLDTRLLLKPWKGYTPALRSQAAGVLLSYALWSRHLLDAIERKEVLPAELEAAQRQVLLSHPDDGLRKAAKKLFASASDADRDLAVSRYWLEYPDQADAKRGAKLFAAKCAACHRLGEVGSHVGPELASLADRSPQTLLAAILDPNRAVESRYLNYLAITKEGLTLTGMIASETSTTLTLVSSDGKKHDLLRNQLDELVSTGKSLMPDGMEKDLSVQDMADVIAHVRAAVAAPKKGETRSPNQP